jgi:tRNA (guanine-N7-)-methyltransferase
MSMPEREAERKRGAFFGRRKGHRLRAGQAQLFETLLPRLALDLTGGSPNALPPLFAPAVTDVRLEIGFGGGEHLTAQAEAHPRTGFIGCEPFANGMASALAAIHAKRLSNVRLHFGDAIEVIDWLAPGSLQGIDLIYPDPWPKRRHWKRRFVQDSTIPELARVLRPGGEFRFATDVADYAAWVLQRFLRSPDFAWTAECADDWRRPWPEYARTRYEAKAVRAGRAACYLVFRRR